MKKEKKDPNVNPQGWQQPQLVVHNNIEGVKLTNFLFFRFGCFATLGVFAGFSIALSIIKLIDWITNLLHINVVI